jgi:hypothetical protein
MGPTFFKDRDPYSCLAFRQVLLQAFGQSGDEVGHLTHVTAAQVAFAEALVSFQLVQVCKLWPLSESLQVVDSCQRLSFPLSFYSIKACLFTRHHNMRPLLGAAPSEAGEAKA